MPLSSLSFSLLGLTRAVSAITLSVASSGGNATSGYQYGIMFEDISHSGDGGIYAELIQNRAFQGNTVYPSALDPWTAVGDAVLSLDGTIALSTALPESVKVTASSDGTVGIKNPGWWGIDIKTAKTYAGSFYALGAYDGNFTASVVSDITNETLATVTIASLSVADSWTKHEYTLVPSADAANSNNSFILSFEAASGDAVNFNLISLFPPTYKDTPNGNRVDLMQNLADLSPRYFRIPGGNNLEGNDPPYRWYWNATLGNLTQRPGRPGTWTYENTDGIGLIEYMLWCQDLGVEPVLAVWSGLYLDGTIIAEADLAPYVDDALNELEFLTGDSSTTYGAQRIALGYTNPFPIKFVEVGNEDGLNGGLDSYSSYRFNMFYDAISAAYPDIIIFSSNTDYVYENSGQDYHEYTRPDYFVSQFGYFDNWALGHPIMVGEFASVQNNTGNPMDQTDWSAGKNLFPYWIGTVSEAVFLLGVERNPDKVWGVSYAPLLENLNSYQWSPDLIAFTADPSQTVLSTSYHMLRLFGNNQFTSTLPATAGDEDMFGPAYWVAGVDNATSTYYVKAAVYNSTEDMPFNITFDGVTSGGSALLTVLSAADGYSYNGLGTGEAVVTTTSSLTADADGVFSFSLPNLSVAVLAAKA